MLKKFLTAVLPLILILSLGACANLSSHTYAAEVETETSRYAVVNTTLTWEAAKTASEAAGGHLATITSQAEQDEIVNLLASIDDSIKRNSYFLGAYDNYKTGTYKWVTGEAFDYTYWKANEPKPKEGEQYLSIFAKTYNGNSGVTEPGRWNDCMSDGTAYSGAGDTGFFSPEQMGYIIEWDK
jgi:hypothetical protein